MTTNTTYTHVGGKAAVGHKHHGRDFAHYAPKAGRIHALNAGSVTRGGWTQAVWVAVCGETVPLTRDDCQGYGDEHPVQPAGEGVVTCKRCLARLAVGAEPDSLAGQQHHELYPPGNDTDF